MRKEKRKPPGNVTLTWLISSACFPVSFQCHTHTSQFIYAQMCALLNKMLNGQTVFIQFMPGYTF